MASPAGKLSSHRIARARRAAAGPDLWRISSGALQRPLSDSNCLSAEFAARAPCLAVCRCRCGRVAPAWRRFAHEDRVSGPVELVRLFRTLWLGADTMLGLQVEGVSTLRLRW